MKYKYVVGTILTEPLTLIVLSQRRNGLARFTEENMLNQSQRPNGLARFTAKEHKAYRDQNTDLKTTWNGYFHELNFLNELEVKEESSMVNGGGYTDL